MNLIPVTDHTFGDKSEKVYNTLHVDLQTIMLWTLKLCAVDFSLVEGYRDPAVQFEYYKRGREYRNGKWVITDRSKVITNIDGYNTKSKHNYNPSLAVDIMIYIKDKPELAYDRNHLLYIIGSAMSIAEILHNEGIISHRLRSGANWDRDGELIYDQKLIDLPHLELINN